MSVPNTQSPPPRPEYGLDAPGLVRAFFCIGIAAAVAAAAILLSPWGGQTWAAGAAGVASAAALYGVGMGAWMVYWSRVLKVRGRERLLDLIPWRGDETVLDVGCGRGLMLVGAALRVPDGGAVGVDVWRAADQGDNRPDAALENARREGVAGRVTVETADMRELPCQDGSFDVVVSHWAVHNLEARADRERAVHEMVRVLKSGGTVVLADIQHHAEYEGAFAAAGLADVRRVKLGWLGVLSAVLSLGNFRPAAVTGRKRVSSDDSDQ